MLWVHARRVGYRFCGLWGTRRSCTQPRSCTIAYTLLCKDVRKDVAWLGGWEPESPRHHARSGRVTDVLSRKRRTRVHGLGGLIGPMHVLEDRLGVWNVFGGGVLATFVGK